MPFHLEEYFALLDVNKADSIVVRGDHDTVGVGAHELKTCDFATFAILACPVSTLYFGEVL